MPPKSTDDRLATVGFFKLLFSHLLYCFSTNLPFRLYDPQKFYWQGIAILGVNIAPDTLVRLIQISVEIFKNVLFPQLNYLILQWLSELLLQLTSPFRHFNLSRHFGGMATGLLLNGFDCFRNPSGFVRPCHRNGCPREAGLLRHGLQNVCNGRPSIDLRPWILVQGLEDGHDRCRRPSFPLAALLALSAGICEVSAEL